jgi:integral membrane sensor domain MASE1
MSKKDDGKKRHAVEPPARQVAARRPRLQLGSSGGMGALLAIALGLGLLALAAATALRDEPLPMPLTVALVVAGALQAAFGWFTLNRRRGAWAFATSLSGTAAVAFLFSAPKIRDALQVDLGVALVPALVGAAACIMLALAAADLK